MKKGKMKKGKRKKGKMKKATRTAIAVLLLILPVMYIKAKHFWRGETMSLKKVCKTWGSAPLDIAKFKQAEKEETEEAEDTTRAKMACSLLKNQKKYIGKDTSEIRNLFGDYTGHYFIDMSPAYIIGGTDKKDTNTWQIVFLINRHIKISKIIVHKNCCN